MHFSNICFIIVIELVFDYDYMGDFMRKRLYVDLDGTVARFHDEPNYLSKMYNKGFFINLKPFENVVEGIRYFIKQNPSFEVSVLSTVVSGYYCQEEKLMWVQRYLPEIHSVILVPEGKSKDEFVCDLTCNDILLDDYNVNLLHWKKAGGKAVKLVNNINNMGRIGRKWQGDTVSYNDSPNDIAGKLYELFTYNQLNLFDMTPSRLVLH